MSFSGPSQPPAQPVLPAAPPPPPMFGQAPTPAKKQQQTNGGMRLDPTILGQSPAGTGQKTLLGQ